MKLRKCHFFSKEIQELGHILNTKGIQPLPIKNMHPLTTTKQLHAFLSLVGYYWKFIKNFCENSQTLNTTNMTAKANLTGQQTIMKLSWISRNPSPRHLYYITLTLIRGI